MKSEPYLDPATVMALEPIHECGRQARNERDAWNRWSVALAVDMGVSLGGFKSEVIAEQYAELRNRISAKVKADKSTFYANLKTHAEAMASDALLLVTVAKTMRFAEKDSPVDRLEKSVAAYRRDFPRTEDTATV